MGVSLIVNPNLWSGKSEGLDMTLSTSDLIAVVIALALANTMLVIAFRRIYVLERRIRNYRGFLTR